MLKPWFKSTAIVGALTGAIGFLARPENLDLLRVLPLNDHQRAVGANIVTAAGLAAGFFGIRRAIPDATVYETGAGQVALHDPTGVVTAALSGPRNEYGETPAQETARRKVMDAKGVELVDDLRSQGR